MEEEKKADKIEEVEDDLLGEDTEYNNEDYEDYEEDLDEESAESPSNNQNQENSVSSDMLKAVRHLQVNTNTEVNKDDKDADGSKEVDQKEDENVEDSSTEKSDGNTEVEEKAENDETDTDESEEAETNVKPDTFALTADMEVEDDDDDSNIDGLSADDELLVLADSILSGCFVGNEQDVENRRNQLISQVSTRLFRNEDYLIYFIVRNYSKRNVKIDEDFIRICLLNDRKIIQNAVNAKYINLSDYNDVGGDQVQGYVSGVCKHFRTLLQMPEITTDEFNADIIKYQLNFKTIEANRIYQNGIQILNATGEGREKTGFEESSVYVRKALADIDGLVDVEQGTGFTSASDLLQRMNQQEDKTEVVSHFDFSPTLDNLFGGLKTRRFYSFIAPPKGGKTRFCLRICYDAMMNGAGVVVWPHEGGQEEWFANMRYIHLKTKYAGESVVNSVTRDMILDGTGWDNLKPLDNGMTLKNLELTSALDLVSNTNYGKLEFVNRPFNVETFLDDIDTAVNDINAKVVIIDYLQLIGSEDPRKNERERVSEAYQKALAYCKAKNIALISPAQFRQTTIEEMYDGGDNNGTIDLRTAAGVSSEVIRSPDVLFALWQTAEDKANSGALDRLRILTIPSRVAATLKRPIKLEAHFDTCYFKEIREDNNN